MIAAHNGPVLNCNGRTLDLSVPQVMGILNITPDSFSDGGCFLSLSAAIDHASRMIKEGAAIIDIGGESTRPGAEELTVQQELDRVLPVVEALSSRFSVPLSVDTSKPEVMRESVAAGAGMINDVRALAADGAIELIAKLGVPVCLMHMQGQPRTMQQQPRYENVVAEVCSFLKTRAETAIENGIAAEMIVLDPGFGFGKTLEHNRHLLNSLATLTELSYPILVGVSRKSMIGSLLGLPADQRLYGSLAAAVIAVREGAKLVRAHDVRPTLEAITVAAAIAD